jgi:cytochrome b561
MAPVRPPYGRPPSDQTAPDVDDSTQQPARPDSARSVYAEQVSGRRPATRRRVPARTQLDFWLDLVLLVAFALDYSFQFTGLSIHEWIGLGFGVALLLHITLHWDWVLRTTRRVFGKLAGRERIRWVVDLGLLVVMTLCVASGILISRSALPALGITPMAGAFWTGLHTTSADVTVALVGLHVALSWRWSVTVGRRILRRKTAASTR